MALSDTWLRSHLGRPIDKQEIRTDRDGLSVRLSPKGKLTFQVRYRFNGSPKRLDIGSYPNVSLKEAREECLRLKGELDKGHDPKIIKMLEKTSNATAQSFRSLFELWHNSYCVLHKKNHAEIKRSFDIYVLKEFGDLPATEITLHRWMSLLDEVVKRSPSIAERILINTKQVYKWGMIRQYLNENPLATVSALHDLHIKKKSSYRSLTAKEVYWVWLAIEQSRMSLKNGLFIKLCLIFGCRGGELRVSKISDFDLVNKIWSVPPENHKTGNKTGKPLLRPIIPSVELMIKEAISLSGNSEYLFCNVNSDEPMGKSSPLALPYNIRQWLRKNNEIEMEHWSIHDLRKTARTNLSELAPPHVCEIILGHSLPGKWQVYDHYDYLKEQAEAYDAWWEKLSGIVELTPSSMIPSAKTVHRVKRHSVAQIS